jgi:hypothetical protein
LLRFVEQLFAGIPDEIDECHGQSFHRRLELLQQTGKKFLPIPTSGEKAAARLSLLLEMHESGHCGMTVPLTLRCPQTSQALTRQRRRLS